MLFRSGLPGAHGQAVAWLERDLAEHGPRPWAVLRQVLSEQDELSPEARQLADGDALPDACFEDLASTLSTLQLRAINEEIEATILRAAEDPALLPSLRALNEQRNALKERQKQLSQRAASE